VASYIFGIKKILSLEEPLLDLDYVNGRFSCAWLPAGPVPQIGFL
jgi:hypothetical protein